MGQRSHLLDKKGFTRASQDLLHQLDLEYTKDSLAKARLANPPAKATDRLADLRLVGPTQRGQSIHA